MGDKIGRNFFLEALMQPDASRLQKQSGILTALIGFYDAPVPAPFEPLVGPTPGQHACMFAFYKSWQNGILRYIYGAKK